MIRYEIAFHPHAGVSILYRCLQEVALLSRSAIEEARRHLPGFPAAEYLPRPTRRTPEGRFQYVPGAWTAATRASVVTEFRGTKRKYDPTKWRQLRTDFCDIWSLVLEEVAAPTAQFFREHGALRVFAAEAGGGGDCFFLSTAVVLMQARAVHPRLLNLFTSDEVTDWDDRTTVAAALRKIVGRHMRAKTPKAFLNFVVGCLVRETARTWLDDWSMIALLRGSPFAFLKDANDVLGAEVTDDAMLVRYKEGDSSVTRSKRVRSGTAALVSLRDAVSTALETCGNTHWATDVDFVALATELNLGFIIAGNTWTQTSVVRGSGDTSNKPVCDKSIRMLD